jgi:hypothetical protein
MRKELIPVRIFQFYLDGFRSMDLGKKLWIIILIKLFIMFVVLKIFFFPRYLNQFDSTSEKEDYVSQELIDRAF